MTSQSNKGELRGERLPFRRLELAFNKIIKTSIPYHLVAIQRHKQLIEEYRRNREWDLLMRQQISGLQSVQRLKADLRQLESLTEQVMPEDYQLISQQIDPIKSNVCSVVQQFLESNEDLNNPLLGLDSDHNSGSDLQNDSNQSLSYHSINESNVLIENNSSEPTLQMISPISGRTDKLISWLNLNKELNDLNDIFNTLINTLKGQKERVNTIENNVESAEQNVLIGTQHLSKASGLKSAFVPLSAGLIGGALFGPIGVLAGFKFSGALAAIGGSIAGYSGVKYIQNKSKTKTDDEFEMISNQLNVKND